MARVIMVQGTMSNVGKSLIVAGLCRIFRQDGYRVAPFKSQNMALNSFITKEGLEMGRAQVMQAEAAGIEPLAAMNPILLKPTTDVGSQVIVNGEVLGNMRARDYFAYKKKLIPDIMRAFHRLEEEYEIIVIEGAGSPAEINLKSDDIVNMGMAKLADAPVLLVGDIDRGGVFAQLIGTVMLLDDEERRRVKGLIINKFRGDKTILDPGIEMLEARAGIPVLGAVPYLRVQLEDEDSLSMRFEEKREAAAVDIAVLRLPRISNFTDFNPFENMPGVSLRYVDAAAKLGNPDMIILPGTKSTMEDLRFLRTSGLEAAVLKAAAAGTVIFGICGGYQMLGESISDPEGAEGGGELRGMGLLPMRTVFAGEKTRTRVCGVFQKPEGILSSLAGERFAGYEIHMGISTPTEDCRSLAALTNELARADGAQDPAGCRSMDGANRGNIYGTYVHGIFDQENCAKAVAAALARAKGLDAEKITAVDFAAFKEKQYDLLADGLRASLDMEKIYEILNAGEKGHSEEGEFGDDGEKTGGEGNRKP